MVEGRRIRCYLDGKLVTDAIDEPALPPSPIYATASRENSTGDVILKVVNIEPTPRAGKVRISGAERVAPQAEVHVLAGAPADVNTLDEPQKVATKSTTIDAGGPEFQHEFPPHSVTVMRLHTK